MNWFKSIFTRKAAAPIEAEILTRQLAAETALHAATKACLTHDRRTISTLRGMLDELRTELHAKAMTTTERQFLAICQDIAKNGKCLSQRRLNAMMEKVRIERGHSRQMDLAK